MLKRFNEAEHLGQTFDDRQIQILCHFMYSIGSISVLKHWTLPQLVTKTHTCDTTCVYE